MAAINKSLALVQVTLCFLVVLAAAQGDTVALIVHGEARCKYNSSLVISNSTLHLMINGTAVLGSTGTTTSTGQIVMTVNLTSPEQVDALTSNSSQVLVVAPPHACGAPSIPAGTVVASRLRVRGADDEEETPTVSNIVDIIDGSVPASLASDQLFISATVVDPFSCVVFTNFGL